MQKCLLFPQGLLNKIRNGLGWIKPEACVFIINQAKKKITFPGFLGKSLCTKFLLLDLLKLQVLANFEDHRPVFESGKTSINIKKNTNWGFF